jgi:regulatory protein YycI of two-component signal transduction system YycFG
LIKEHWEIAQMDRYRSGQQEVASYDDEVLESIEEGADRPLGRRLSLSELFGQR